MKNFLTVGGLSLVVLSIFLVKPKMQDFQVEKKGEVVTMEITKLPQNCVGTKVSHYVTVRYGSEYFVKTIGAGFCDDHKVGDQIEMRYLQGHDNVLFPQETIVSEFVALLLLGLIGFIIFIKGLRN